MENKLEESPIGEPEEEIADEFQCCVCLELLYKPVVLPCGHISCFWCVFRAMDSWQESNCPMCRHPYNHFPSICQLLNSVLLQLYPIAYKRREQLITEQENRSEWFSPQFDNHLSLTKPSKELNILDGAPPHSSTSSFSESTLGSCSSANKSSTIKGHFENVGVSNEDLMCAICKELLYRPVVLNCGHVYCKACIICRETVSPKCEVCGSAHPSGYLKVCLALEQFLEKQFSEQYAARKKAAVKSAGNENQTSACSPRSQTNVNMISSSSTNNGHLGGAKAHYGYGCDYCGMFPIIGERYNCRDCREIAGFDLCGSCYNNPPKTQGRFNQQHKPDHKLEITQPTRLVITLQPDTPEQDDDTNTEEDNNEDIPSDNTVEEVTYHTI